MVQKAAVDFWRLPVERFREDRFATHDIDRVVRLEATVDGRTMAFRREPDGPWRQEAPIAQPGDRRALRRMLGRTGALRAMDILDDAPVDRETWGLAPPRHRVAITLVDGETVTLEVGRLLLERTPQQRAILRVEDGVVYAARDGFLEAFLDPLADYRDPSLIRLPVAAVTRLTVSAGDRSVEVLRGEDGWTWPDGEGITGARARKAINALLRLRPEAPIRPRPLGGAEPSGPPWRPTPTRLSRWSWSSGGRAGVPISPRRGPTPRCPSVRMPPHAFGRSWPRRPTMARATPRPRPPPSGSGVPTTP